MISLWLVNKMIIVIFFIILRLWHMIMITIVILMLPVLKDHCDHDYHCVHNDHCDYDVHCNHDDNCDLDDHCEQLVQIIKMFLRYFNIKII